MDKIYKYQKISDTLDKYNCTKNDCKKLHKVKWVAMEKVHGSNFAIYYNKGKINFSKRNSVLEDDEWFYNYHLIKKELINNTRKLASFLISDTFIIYGELFGGFYPEDTEKWEGPVGSRLNEKGVSIIPFEERAIQEGIYYSPNVEYMVFDIVKISEDNEHFVNYTEMIDLAKKSGFFYARPLKLDSFENILEYNLNFNSKIPKWLGLNKLPDGTNIAEGIVIKPVQNIYVENKKGEKVRCLIKIKNKKFIEVSEEFDMEEAKKSYKFIFHQLVNQNRFQSVISKIGKLTQENKDEIIEELYIDTFNDFYENYNLNYGNFKKVEEFVKNICTILVEDNMEVQI